MRPGAHQVSDLGRHHAADTRYRRPAIEQEKRALSSPGADDAAILKACTQVCTIVIAQRCFKMAEVDCQSALQRDRGGFQPILEAVQSR